MPALSLVRPPAPEIKPSISTDPPLLPPKLVIAVRFTGMLTVTVLVLF